MMKKITRIKTILIFAMLLSSVIISGEPIKNEILKSNLDGFVGKKKIKLTCSQSDAEIYVNDQLLSKGNVEIEIPNEGCATVHVEKVGYISEDIEFCNKDNLEKLPKSHHFNLIKDEAYDATITSDIVNIDHKIAAKEGKDKAWVTINQVVLDNFDAIEMADKETGYIRTDWVVKRFKHSAVRTRFIVKQFSSNPLVFKVKLASEHTMNSNAGSRHDEHFKEWDRILRKYANIESELDARVK